MAIFRGCSLWCRYTPLSFPPELFLVLFFHMAERYNHKLQAPKWVQLIHENEWALSATAVVSSQSPNTNNKTGECKHMSFSCQLKWTHSPIDQWYLEVNRRQIDRNWRVQHGYNTSNQLLLLRYANHSPNSEKTQKTVWHGCREWQMWR